MTDAARYEELRSRHVAVWGQALPDRLARLEWDRPRIEAHQWEALRGLVAHAQARSPWHRERLAGVEVEALEPADVMALPTMTKTDLMEHFDAIVTHPGVRLADAERHLACLDADRYLLDELHVVASGGSSGQRGVFVYGWEPWVDVHLGLSRWVIADLFANPPAEPGGATVMGVVAANNATHMTTAVATTFASPMVDVHQLPVALPVPEIVAGLNALQPRSLTAYASMLGVLATEQAEGRLRIAPARIVATSEPLLPEVRAAAESAFGVPVANCWGTSEGGVMAVGCWQAGGMHVNEDLVLLEPVDAEGRPVAPGERAAKVLLTNLFNPDLPLIRYELTDEAVFLDEPCPCGSRLRRVGDVEGRTDDLLRFDAITVHPHVLRSVLGRHRELVEYQVRQRPGGVEVLVTGAGLAPDVLTKELADALERAGLPDSEVVVRCVDRLDRHPTTGKLARFVPLPA